MNGNLLHLYHDNAAEFRSFYIIYKYGKCGRLSLPYFRIISP